LKSLDEKEGAYMNDEVLQGNGHAQIMSADFWDLAHSFVPQNVDPIQHGACNLFHIDVKFMIDFSIDMLLLSLTLNINCIKFNKMTNFD
jgi:hypothetical protein